MKSVTVHRATRRAAAISVSLTLFPAKTINTGNRYSTYSYSRGTEFIGTSWLIRYFPAKILSSSTPPLLEGNHILLSRQFHEIFPVLLIFYRVSKGKGTSSRPTVSFALSSKLSPPPPFSILVSLVSSENRNAIYNSSVYPSYSTNLFFKRFPLRRSRRRFCFFSPTSQHPASSTFFERKDRREERIFSPFFRDENVDKRKPTFRKFSREKIEKKRRSIGIIILSDR